MRVTEQVRRVGPGRTLELGLETTAELIELEFLEALKDIGGGHGLAIGLLGAFIGAEERGPLALGAEASDLTVVNSPGCQVAHKDRGALRQCQQGIPLNLGIGR